MKNDTFHSFSALMKDVINEWVFDATHKVIFVDLTE